MIYDDRDLGFRLNHCKNNAGTMRTAARGTRLQVLFRRLDFRRDYATIFRIFIREVGYSYLFVIVSCSNHALAYPDPCHRKYILLCTYYK